MQAQVSALFSGGLQGRDVYRLGARYKADAARDWQAVLARPAFEALLESGRFREIAAQAIRNESRTNLLFSFEKMALRDAVRTSAGARRFAEGLHGFLHGTGTDEERFTRWCEPSPDCRDDRRVS